MEGDEPMLPGLGARAEIKHFRAGLKCLTRDYVVRHIITGQTLIKGDGLAHWPMGECPGHNGFTRLAGCRSR